MDDDCLNIGIAYATHQVHIPDGLLKEKVVVAGASRKEPIGLGMLFYEDGNWGLTTFGTGNVPPPTDFAEMCEVACACIDPHNQRRLTHEIQDLCQRPIENLLYTGNSIGRSRVGLVSSQQVNPIR